MYRLLLAILVLSITMSSVASAQFGGLTDKAKDKASEEADQAKTKATKGERPAAVNDPNRQYPPGLSFSALLNGVKLLPKNGRFDLNQIQATFIPDDCEGGLVVLRTADGTELYEWDWRPDRLEKPYTLLSIHGITNLATGERKGGGGADMAKPGDYVLDFYLPTEHFYTFPFTITKVGGDDPFGDGQCYVLSGEWADHGYLYYRKADPEQSLQWKVWVRNDACTSKDIKVHIEIKRDADGEVVCTSRKHKTNSAQPQWVRLEFDMVFPEGKEVPHGTYFKAKDLLATDGAYTLTMTIDGNPHGTWKFGVEGGKLTYTGRTLRGEADPLTFIEGGRDAWWYTRQ
jgi:hypothetical protein